MWIYEQKTGWLSKEGKRLYQGYAGKGKGKNNPAMEHVHNVGPLPAGFYTIKAPINTEKHGPYFLPLIPDKDNQMYGRSAFGCHGDSKENPGEASEGCMIMPRPGREMMYQSGDDRLQVVGDIEQPSQD